MSEPYRNTEGVIIDKLRSLSCQARVYFAANAWTSVRNLLSPHLDGIVTSSTICPDYCECLCLDISACYRLGLKDELTVKQSHVLDIFAKYHDVLDPEAYYLAVHCIAQYYADRGDLQRALRTINSQSVGSVDEVSVWARARFSILSGRIKAQTGDLNGSLENGFRAAQLAAQICSDGLIGDAYVHLGLLARLQGHIEDACNLYSKAAAHYDQTADSLGQVSVYINTGLAFIVAGLFDKASEYLGKAAELSALSNQRLKFLRASLGLAYMKYRSGEMISARNELLASYQASKRIRATRERVLTLEYLIEMYALNYDYRKANIAMRLCRRLVDSAFPDSDLAIELELRIALLRLAEGRFHDAIAKIELVEVSASNKGMVWEEALAKRIKGIAHVRLNNYKSALRSFQCSLVLFERLGDQLEAPVIREWINRIENDPAQRVSAALYLRPEIAFGLYHPLIGPLGLDSTVEDAQSAQPPIDVGTSACVQPLNRSLPNSINKFSIVTASAKMQELLQTAAIYAKGQNSILILGETGTGKDLVAQGIHELSLQTGAYVPINCATLRGDRLNADLFGVKKGAYTGADIDRRGLIDEAENGTLFLDEIGDLELDSQGYLLRFLDTGEVRPLGGTKYHTIRTRILAATCQNIAEMVKDGRFRRDLHARLAGVTLQIPPLRDRLEDLPQLIDTLWKRCNGTPQLYRGIFTRDVIATLSRFEWPQNIRQLYNIVRNVQSYSETTSPADVRSRLVNGFFTGQDLTEIYNRSKNKKHRWSAERLTEALEKVDGDISEAAVILGISRATAYRLYKSLREGAIK
jgi:DNA-binding NtrC family response regulator